MNQCPSPRSVVFHRFATSFQDSPGASKSPTVVVVDAVVVIVVVIFLVVMVFAVVVFVVVVFVVFVVVVVVFVVVVFVVVVLFDVVGVIAVFDLFCCCCYPATVFADVIIVIIVALLNPAYSTLFSLPQITQPRKRLSILCRHVCRLRLDIFPLIAPTAAVVDSTQSIIMTGDNQIRKGMVIRTEQQCTAGRFETSNHLVS